MKLISRIIKHLIPWKLYKLLANGFVIVPKYYKQNISELEHFFDLSLEDNIEKDIMLMRKFGHIIDKGLHRADATPGHSKEIYIDLKALIDKLKDTVYANDSTYLWTKSKLDKYESLQKDPSSFTPFRNVLKPSPISFEDVSSLVKQRRSNRSFSDNQISNEIIDKLKDLANWAANSCNKQPIRLFVTNNQSLAKECLKCCAGGTGFGDNIPSFWCFTANVRGYVWPSEMYLPSIDVSLGAQNVFLAAKTLGITGTILSWGQHTKYEDKQLRELLNIPQDYVIIFCAVMGYAEYEYLPPARKNIQ